MYLSRAGGIMTAHDFTPENVMEYIASPMADIEINSGEVIAFVRWLLWGKPSVRIAERLPKMKREDIEALMVQYKIEKGVAA
jgi:hypothetical protein